MSFIRPNDKFRKKQMLVCPKTCQLYLFFFFLPVSNDLIKDMSSPGRACLLMPRNVLFTLTFLESIETMQCFSSALGSCVATFPHALAGADPELPSWRRLLVVQSSPLHGQTHYSFALSCLVR